MYFHRLLRDTYCSKKYFIYATEQWKGLCGISAAEIYSICDSKMQERIIIILDIEWILDIERILELVSTIEYRFHGQRPDVHIVTMH